MSMSGELRNRLADNGELVEGALEALYSALGPDCEYSLAAGGKRIRPFLVIESCRALGGGTESAIHGACAVEMIHTYSLIHDDLPGMDDDDLRRGKPSLHRVVGVQSALKAGDRLLREAFIELSRTPLPEDVVRKMLLKLARASGAEFLVGGQFMDMYHPEKADSAWTRQMILGKTSAMIRVSMELGALAAGMTPGELAILSGIGDDTGWLFQLTDDILDVTGTTGEMGKAVYKDADAGKWNPVSELGLEQARALAEETALDVCSRLESLSGDWSMISSLVRYLPERRK